MVVVAAWPGGSLRAVAGAHAVFRPLAAALRALSPRCRSCLRGRRLHHRTARLLHPVLPGAHGSAAFLHHRRRGGRHVVDDYHGDRFPIHPQREGAAAPAWMTRSFAVALVFLEVRVIMGVTGWD